MGDDSSKRVSPHLLSSQAEWVRALTARLIDDTHLAEDVSQESLLRALERPPERVVTVRSWFRRVIANVRIEEFRRRRTRAVQECALADAELLPVHDDSVERSELQRLILEALGELSEKLRTVVQLRYFEGQPPRTIAKQLGVPVETVRSRLKLAFTQLRVDLRRRFGNDDNAWRHALMPLLAAPTSSVTGSGQTVLLMDLGRRAILTLVILLGLVTAIWGAASGFFTIGQERAPRHAFDTRTSEDEPSRSPHQRAGHVRRTSVSTAVPEKNVLDREDSRVRHAVIRGRCVDAKTGFPLASCRVAFTGRPSNDEVMVLHGTVEWTDPNPVFTGEDGRFEIRFLPPPPYQHHLDIALAGRVPRTASWSAFRQGQVEELGDIPLQVGHAIRGRVVDREGQPVENFAVGIPDLPLPLTPGANDRRFGLSAAGGSFVMESPVPAGTWPLKQGHGPYRLVSPRTIEVLPDDTTQVVVEVERKATIAGTLLDAAGLPVEGAIVRADYDPSGTPATRSREDGSFTLYEPCRDARPTSIRIEPGVCESHEHSTRVSWGTEDLRIAVQRALTLELEVVDTDTGSPIEDFAVRCHRTNDTSSLAWSARLGGHHPEGKLVIDGILRGSNELVVIPKDEAYLESQPVHFIMDDGDREPMRIALDRAVQLSVRVEFEDGRSVQGSRVDLIEHPFDRAIVWSDPVVPKGSLYMNPGYGGPIQLDARTTDVTGTVDFLVRARSENLLLRIRGATHLAKIVEDIMIDQGRHLVVVTVDPGATLQGSLIPTSLAALEPCLLLRNPSREPSQYPHPSDPAVQLRVGADGHFEFSGLPAGSWNVRLSVGTRVLDEPIGSVELKNGETRDVTLDGSRYAPARLHGTITVRGKPAQVATLDPRLGGKPTPPVLAPKPHKLTQAGGYDLDGILPGRYAFALTWFEQSSNAPRHMTITDLFTLHPGEDMQKDIDVVPESPGILQLQGEEAK